MKKLLALAVFIISSFNFLYSYGQVCLPRLAHDSLQMVATQYGNYSNVSRTENIGDTLFMLGGFSYLGPYTGGMAPVDTNGKIIRPNNWPRIHGAVYVMVPDDDGGFYIGGSFMKVGDSIRRNFVQLDKHGQVTPFKIDVSLDTPYMRWESESIKTMVRIDDKLYMTGRFSFVNGRTRDNYACYDLTKQQIIRWKSQILEDAKVTRMLVHKGNIYITGKIYQSDIYKRKAALICLDSASNYSTGWDVRTGDKDDNINDIFIDGDTIYICGSFGKFGNINRFNIAAYDLVNMNVRNWDPSPSSGVASVCVLKNYVYIIGSFLTVGPWSFKTIARINKNTGIPDFSWKPNVLSINTVSRMRIHRDKLYITGIFTHISRPGQPSLRYHGTAAIDTFGTTTSWSPNVGRLNSYKINDYMYGSYDFYFNKDTIYIMGEINSVGGEPVNSFGAINTNNNNILPINIFGKAENISTIKRNNNLFYFGVNNGSRIITYDRLSRKIRNNLAAYDFVGDSVTSWNPPELTYNLGTPSIRYIETLNGKLYVAGTFNYRNGFVEIDSATGNISSQWNAKINGFTSVKNVSANNNLLYISGSFTAVGTTPRKYLAVLDQSANLQPWQADSLNVYPLSLDFLGNKLYIGTADSSMKKVDSASSLANPTVSSWDPISHWKPTLYRRTLKDLKAHHGKIYGYIGGGFFAANIDTATSGSANIVNVGGSTTGYRFIDSSLYITLGDSYSFVSNLNPGPYINGGQIKLTGLARFDLYSKTDTGKAKIVAPTPICASNKQNQLWYVNTNMQIPIFTWFINGDTAIHDLREPSTRLHVNDGDTVYCMVTANAGCYTAYTISTDTIIVKSNVINTASARLIGPDTVCKDILSRYKLNANFDIRNYNWTFNNGKINIDTNEYYFIPSTTGKLICSFTVADTGCFSEEFGADTIDIAYLSKKINPSNTFYPSTSSNKCVGDSMTVKLKSNFHWAKYQWSINGTNSGLNTDSIIIQSLKIGDKIKCIAIADTPNCFTRQVIEDSVITTPQTIKQPTIGITGPSIVSTSSSVSLLASPNNAGNIYEIFWRKNGLPFDTTISNNTAYTKAPGIDTIVATIKPTGCYDTATSNVLIITDALGVNSISGDRTVYAYPNPFSTTFRIKGLKVGYLLNVYDISHKRLMKTTKVEIQRLEHTYDMSNFLNGIYILEIRDSNNKPIRTFKIQKL